MKCFFVVRIFLGNLLLRDRYLRFLRREAACKLPRNRAQSGMILIESDQVYLNQIAQYYSSGPLMKFFSAEIFSYRMGKLNWWTPYTSRIRHFLSLAYGFGSRQLILIDGKVSEPIKNNAQELLRSIRSKRDLETLHVSGILIGDLIYDRFLSSNQVATLDLQSNVFRESFQETLAYFFRWLEFFKNNDVKAVCISHCVYHYAIPARIAIHCRTPVFEITAGQVFKLDEDNLHAVVSNYTLKEIAESGLEENSQAVSSIGNREISEYLRPDASKNFNLNSLHGRIISNNLNLDLDPNKITILIAMHLFYDAPHRYGAAIFPDFYEWLCHLGHLANKTDFNWLIKSHPDLPPSKDSIINELLLKYPKFQLVPTASSHATFVELGVDFVLTVHGSVGFEFPLLGIPVIGANPNAPYADFDFSISPKTIDEFNEIILGLHGNSKTVDKEELASFFYARSVTQFDGWLINNYPEFLQDVGGMNNSMSQKVLQYFVRNPDIRLHSKIEQGLMQFFRSGENVLKMEHFIIQS